MTSKTKTLETLIKIRKQDVDAVRLRLASHLNEYEKVESLCREVKQSIQREKFVATESPEMSKTLALFMEQSHKKVSIYEMQMRQMNDVIQNIRDELAEQFGDLKRLEIALAAHIQSQKKRESDKEQQMYDELAIQRFKPVNT